jgi:hypothetical protein
MGGNKCFSVIVSKFVQGFIIEIHLEVKGVDAFRVPFRSSKPVLGGLDPARSTLQDLFQETLKPALQKHYIGLERMTIIYSRARNLGDIAQHNHLGPTFNTFLPT